MALKGQTQRVRQIADGSIEACQHQDLDQGHFAELCRHRGPKRVVDVRPCMKLIASADQEPVLDDQQGSSALPFASESSIAASSPALLPKNATCTPHSYSEPERAVTRSITTSRWRSVRCPLSRSDPPLRRSNSRASRASVANSARGGAPGGMMRSTGAIRADMAKSLRYRFCSVT